ncbi:MAG: pantetheine-phosphate adenylyltransferase [archaeon]
MRGILGGTFDHFHIGHKHFLKESFLHADELIIGISSDKFAKALSKHPQPLQDFRTREAKLVEYLRVTGMTDDVRVIELNDTYGPAAFEDGLDAIFCTSDTRAGAEKINQLRFEKGLQPLRVMEIRLVRTGDGSPVSSTRIRKGEIDENGHRREDGD